MSRLLINAAHLSKAFGPTTLFKELSLFITEGERLALIGENGSGKTTLFRLLMGLIPPDGGRVDRAGGITVGFLPQEVAITEPELTARQYIEEGPLSELERRMEACLADPNLIAKWASLHEEYEKRGGYKRVPIEKVLKGLKLDNALLEVPMASLSSGQRLRMALAKALIGDPDLLLLDEPTNHLDQEMLTWLQGALRQRKGATVLISHDRQFLNKVCNQLVEIKHGKLISYSGNYDFYLKEQERLLEKKLKAYEDQEEELQDLKQKIKAATFSKGKGAPPKDRNLMAYDHKGEKHQKSQQRSLDDLKSRLEQIEARPLAHPKPKTIKGLMFPYTTLASTVALEFDEVTKALGGKTLFSGFTKTLCKGDRVILTGPNGSGKTTLLQCAMSLLPVDSGAIKRAPTAKIAYLDQEVSLIPMNETPLDYFAGRFGLSEEALRRELHMAALGSVEGGLDLLNRPFSLLSVGQRKRLMLLSLILEKPNVLLLDEPTNHLDLLTIEAFEKALLSFEGAVLAVSHDTTFIEKIATQTWALTT